jgi:hypothetical protein
VRLKSRIDNIEKRLDQETDHVWNETEYQRVSGVLQHGFDDFARDPDSKVISEIKFLQAAKWIWDASIASGRCTENELLVAADSLKSIVASADEA